MKKRKRLNIHESFMWNGLPHSVACVAGRRKGGKGSKRPFPHAHALRALVFFPFPPLTRMPRRLFIVGNKQLILLLFNEKHRVKTAILCGNSTWPCAYMYRTARTTPSKKCAFFCCEFAFIWNSLSNVSVGIKTCLCWRCYECGQFQIEIRKISRCGSRSPGNAEFGHFTLLFCRGWQRNVPRITIHVHAQPLFCSLKLCLVTFSLLLPWCFAYVR